MSLHVVIGTAPCSWGVWWPDGTPSGTPWNVFLDQAAAAGYSALELGPVGYLPTDLEQLKDEIDYAVLTERMLDKYDTNQETAQKILMDFLSMLAEKELLVDANGNLIKESALREAVYFF